MHRQFWAALMAIGCFFVVQGRQTKAEEPDEAFETRVRPVLAETCFPCHGGKKTSGGLRVDSREALVKGGDSGPAVMPGDPDASPLVQAVRHIHDDLKMPPGKKLADNVVADLAAWIKQGANWPNRTGQGSVFHSQRHWAFEPVRDVEPPADSTLGSKHPIDRFLAERWRTEGLKPVELADKRVLIRRLTFDLTGLPPTPAETLDFLADDQPEAYNRLVERLLASPRYGERWGRHWLDVAHYADTAGDNADYPVPELAKYRDYVIDSFNADKPFDRFVREQIAGDIIAAEGPAEQYAERVVATGFLALSRRYATAPYELWHLTLEDTIDTTARAFLGMTFRCARCHDHKFDPITRNDYYALYGVFASTNFPYAGSEEFVTKKFPREHFSPLAPPSEAAPKIEAYLRAVEALEAPLKAAEAQMEPADRLKPLRTEVAKLKRPGLPAELPGAYAVSEGKPVDAPIQLAGDPSKPGAVVPRGAPGFLAGAGCPPPSVPSHASGRRELAEWLTQPNQPLTARVMVNRVWQHHLGKGIVGTPSNFGARGEPPTHPELLDWLTARFIADGWSVKALHRRIVTSLAYQRSSRDDPANSEKDPSNRFLWRFDRARLDAESLRDAILAVSGDLNLAKPGPHPFPPIEQWRWTQHNPFRDVYPTDHRSVYLMTQRLQKHPYLALFDGPDTNTSAEARTKVTAPSQTLFLMNNPWMKARAESFAKRASGKPNERVAAMIELAWNRPPTADESRGFAEYVEHYITEASQTGIPAAEAEREAWTSLARVVFNANDFMYVD